MGGGQGKTAVVTSQAPRCADGGASGSVAHAVMFPMQYNGPTYDFETFPEELIFIPFNDDNSTPRNPTNLFSKKKSKKLNHEYGFSALLIHGNPKNNPTHFMILFHGNGVDLGMASAIWRPLIRALPIHLLIVEYPGYGIMNGRCKCKSVIKVAESVYKFVTRPKINHGLGINPNQLIILGRSIGTGPASHLAKQKCHTLILVSPFTSIHNLSNDLVGKFAKYVLPKDYRNDHKSMDHKSIDNNNDGKTNLNPHNDKEPSSTSTSTSSSTSAPSSDEYDDSNNDDDDEMQHVFMGSLDKAKSNPYTLSPRDLHDILVDNKEQKEKPETKKVDHKLLKKYNKNDDDDTHSIYSLGDIDESYLNQIKSDKHDNLLSHHCPDVINEIKHQSNSSLHKSNTSPPIPPRPQTAKNVLSKTYTNNKKQKNHYQNDENEMKYNKKTNTKSKPKKRREPDFVFNNVTQINSWKCKNVMIFHGKKDQLIPYNHSQTIIQTIKKKKPNIKAKLHLIDGVGHNDVNIQHLSLRIFMEYQDELQPSFSDESSKIKLSSIVPFIDDPPQFNITTNKVENFNFINKKNSKYRKHRKKKSARSVKSISSSSCINDDDSDDDDEQSFRIINTFNTKNGKFDDYSRKQSSRVYDMFQKLKHDKSREQIKKVKHLYDSNLF